MSKYLLLLVFLFSPLWGQGKTHLPVTDDFRKAREMSKAFAKPIAVIFLGSDWSDASKKFIEEILQDKNFFEIVGNSFIFVKIDFPELNTQPAIELTQNSLLKEQYKIQNFPTVILIDAKQREFTRLGYISGGGEQYGSHLKRLLNHYLTLWNELEERPLGQIESGRLKELFHLAADLGATHYREQILDYGCSQLESVFFLLEKYNALAARGNMQTPQAKELRAKILEKDPKNLENSRLQLALLDYQYLCASQADFIKPLVPLFDYLKQFGKNDEKAAKSIQTMMVQYISSKECFTQALNYCHTEIEQNTGFEKKLFQHLFEKIKSKESSTGKL